MPHVILGLLMTGPLSLYDLRKRFAAGLSLFYSASFGALQRALRQLVADGAVTVADEPGSARGRRLYSITRSGERSWREWMTAPIEPGADAETLSLARVFLAGRIVDAAERAAVLRVVRGRVEADLGGLTALAADVDARDASDHVEAARFERATLDYGLRAHALMLEWVAELEAGSE